MSEWVAVVQEEGDEPIEIPTEIDSTILLTSLTAQFPGVTGLKFRNPETNGLRGVRCLDNQLYPPLEDGWSNITYICVHPRYHPIKVSHNGSIQRIHEDSNTQATQDAALKRKSENDGGIDGMSSKNIKFEDMEEGGGNSPKPCDLIVLGLHWQTAEPDIRKYFEQFGELALVQLKTKMGTNQSKGFAFIRFVDPSIQFKVTLTRHWINDRWCDVKIPDSQELKRSKEMNSCKIFVGRITQNMDGDDIRKHFETFGAVKDVYIPKPFRSFCFVTFNESRVAQSLWGKEHTLKGVTICIASAHSKLKESEMGRTHRGAPPPHPRAMTTNGGGGTPCMMDTSKSSYYANGNSIPHQMDRQNVWQATNNQGFGPFNGQRGKNYY
ncbi:TAR DNA-binding protein 43 [Lepeophtheirus salmonis]|uniref:TAR DNA-binding protein 43 n=1 Tax=Lepeophtheirus salmonis TaxID=72036 RepID=UPI001AE7779F|nr:TAR DNA-binding protein 43-like [Lepeophtheirus salmonis]XP_040583316.1 TAR DNA-binding protein 43-like [Lepeophtheirus salmonis]